MKNHQPFQDSDTFSDSDISLLDALSECIAACNHCMVSCLTEDDVKPMIRCIELDRDCAALCELGFTLVSTQSQFTDDILKLCADACSRCAAECQKHPMEHCTHCEEVCIKCEQACRDHLKHAKHIFN